MKFLAFMPWPLVICFLASLCVIVVLALSGQVIPDAVYDVLKVLAGGIGVGVAAPVIAEKNGDR